MYIDNLKLLFQFDNNIEDSISSDGLIASGNNTNVSFIGNSLGYMMQQDQYLETPGTTGGLSQLGISNKMVFGFWLYSFNPGLVKNLSNNEMESIEISLIDILEMNTQDTVISTYELTQADNTNKLKIELGNSYSLTTNSYDVEMWHLFWFVYDGETNEIKIIIDGSEDTDTTTTGFVPNSLNGDLIDFYINYRTDGYRYNRMNNYGYIDDIFILDSLNNNNFYLQRVINNSIDYAFDDIYNDYHKDSIGFIINDPNTITINSLIDDMDYVYIATNDGRILRGSPLLWESRKRFSNSNELLYLDKDKVNDSDIDVSINDGFMRINDSVIRL